MPPDPQQPSGDNSAYQPQVIRPDQVQPTASNQEPPALPSRPPIPDPSKLDSVAGGEQFTAQIAQAPPAPQAQPTPQPQQPQVTPPTQAPYDFIMNPEQAKQNKVSLPGGNSMLMRIVIFGAGAVLLLIAFVVLKGLVTSGPDLTKFVSIAQDQQAIIHIASGATNQANISVSNKNFAATTLLSLSSSQKDIIKYLTTNKQKIKPQQLSLKVSTATDEQLTTALAATTYDQTFRDIMKTKLTDYMNHLQQLYKQTDGKNGKALLASDYDQAELLLRQLDQ